MCYQILLKGVILESCHCEDLAGPPPSSKTAPNLCPRDECLGRTGESRLTIAVLNHMKQLTGGCSEGRGTFSFFFKFCVHYKLFFSSGGHLSLSWLHSLPFLDAYVHVCIAAADCFRTHLWHRECTHALSVSHGDKARYLQLMIPPKRFDISPPDWGMLRRPRCVQNFL